MSILVATIQRGVELSSLRAQRVLLTHRHGNRATSLHSKVDGLRPNRSQCTRGRRAVCLCSLCANFSWRLTFSCRSYRRFIVLVFLYHWTSSELPKGFRKDQNSSWLKRSWSDYSLTSQIRWGIILYSSIYYRHLYRIRKSDRIWQNRNSVEKYLCINIVTNVYRWLTLSCQPVKLKR